MEKDLNSLDSNKRVSRAKQVIYVLSSVGKLIYNTKPKYFVVVFVVNVLSGLLVLPSLYIQKQIIDSLVLYVGLENFVMADALFNLSLLIVSSIGLIFVTHIISQISSFFETLLVREFDTKLDILMAKKLSNLDIETIESPRFKNRYTKIMNESASRVYRLISPLSSIPGEVVALVSSIAVLATLTPLAALGVILSSVPRLTVASRFVKRRYEMVGELAPVRRVQGWLNWYLLRNRNMMELKLLGLPEYLAHRYSQNASVILRTHQKFDFDQEKATSISFLPLSFFDAVFTIYLAWLTLGRTITIGSFQLYYQAMRRVQSEFYNVSRSMISIYESYIYVADLMWLLSLKPKISESSGLNFEPTSKVKIEFRNVWFRYKKTGKYILKGVSLVFETGKPVAIVGVNGAGKSTLLKLLARFYDPTKGEILVNGTPLNQINPESWRRQLAILFQDFEGYPFSARETIAFGDLSRLTEIDDVKAAAKATDIAAFIEKLPKKWENPLDPEFTKGVRPSAGQWQRLGISRMLFRSNAGVVVMDEPTSNVDPEAEEQIFAKLSELSGSKILVFVTQRFSTVRRAKQIILLEGGKVLESGTHSFLMKKKSRYHHLFDLQAKSYNFEHEKSS
jgi:ATP-binding cassette, subfamily B, bacterial